MIKISWKIIQDSVFHECISKLKILLELIPLYIQIVNIFIVYFRMSILETKTNICYMLYNFI